MSTVVNIVIKFHEHQIDHSEYRLILGPPCRFCQDCLILPLNSFSTHHRVSTLPKTKQIVDHFCGWENSELCKICLFNCNWHHLLVVWFFWFCKAFPQCKLNCQFKPTKLEKIYTFLVFGIVLSRLDLTWYSFCLQVSGLLRYRSPFLILFNIISVDYLFVLMQTLRLHPTLPVWYIAQLVEC